MSLPAFNLVDLIARYNNGERRVCENLFSQEVNEHYNDLQLLTYLSRYACYNETIEELFWRCVGAIEKGISQVPNPTKKRYFTANDLFDMLFTQRITVSGHRLLQYGHGDTEACVTASFNSFPLAVGNMLTWMKDQRGSGFEIVDIGVKKLFNPLETVATSYTPFKVLHNSTMEYRFNLVVNVANEQVLDILAELLPMSRTSAASNHVTIALLDAFMQAVKENKSWKLYKLKRRIATSQEYLAIQEKPSVVINARVLMDKICKTILSVGKPSIVFLDAMNAPDRIPQLKWNGRKITTTNLCCEISLPTFTNEIATCNIAAVNVADLTNFATAKERARVLTHAMNATMHQSTFPYTRNYRPLGIGTLGSMDNYSKYKSLSLLKEIYFGVYMGCLQASVERAIDHGNFTDFVEIDYLATDSNGKPKYPRLVELSKLAAKYHVLPLFESSFKHRYNITLTAQPPTASMATFCNVSPSLEPCEHNYNLRANNSFIKVQTKDCGLPFARKVVVSEQLIKCFSQFCDQSISASAFLSEPQSLAKLLFDRREYCNTGLYYCRHLLNNETMLCNGCSL